MREHHQEEFLQQRASRNLALVYYPLAVSTTSAGQEKVEFPVSANSGYCPPSAAYSVIFLRDKGRSAGF